MKIGKMKIYLFAFLTVFLVIISLFKAETIENLDISNNLKFKDENDAMSLEEVTKILNHNNYDNNNDISTKFIKENNLEDSKYKDFNTHLKHVGSNMKPVILLAGIYATKLALEISDCSLVHQFHHSLYEACFENLSKQCKRGESFLWMTEEYLSSKTNGCFAEVISFNIKINEKPKFIFKRKIFISI